MTDPPRPDDTRRITDWLWYAEIGFERVFFTKIVAQWVLGAPEPAVDVDENREVLRQLGATSSPPP